MLTDKYWERKALITSTHTMNKHIIEFWHFSTWLQHVNHYYPYRVKDFAQSFAQNQMMSKSWLVERLSMHPIATKQGLSITVLGSWYGTLLVPLLYHYMPNIKDLTLVDYDKEALDISKWFFKNKVNVEHKDISFDINEVTDDIIINTSCEHMWHMRDIKMNGVCAFQSNNFKQDNAHVNCVGSLEEFTYQTGLTKLFFKGVKPFHHINDGSERYMLIGEQ